MAKLSDRLSDLFSGLAKETPKTSVDQLIQTVPVTQSMYPNILRAVDAMAKGFATTPPKVALNSGIYMLCTEIYQVYAYKLMGIHDIACEIIDASAGECLRLRFDAVPDTSFRSAIIDEYLSEHPECRLAEVAQILSLSTEYIKRLLGAKMQH